ncbi:MAG: ATP-dependent Clp protease proteolytic subunit [Elusimicrobia bacterium]|nr:ATP-dependent Clp protease proteolytic subunit [Elusimicrobiota bacterium]
MMRPLRLALAALVCLQPAFAGAQVAVRRKPAAEPAPLPAPVPAEAAPAAGSAASSAGGRSSSEVAQLPAAGLSQPLSHASTAAAPPLLSPLLGMNPEQHKELDKLTAENALVREEVAKRLKDLIEKKEELRIRTDLDAAQLRADLAALDSEYQKLMYENRLVEEKTKHDLETLADQQRRLAAENALADEKHKQELADLHFQKDKLAAANDELQEKLRSEQLSNQSEKMKLDLESQRMSVAEAGLKLERDRLQDASAKLQLRLDERSKKEKWKDQSNHEPVALAQPFADGVLTISDRRIPLNGPIVEGAAHAVSERINFYNNVSTAPIFLVIDSSPGGSVMEGNRILKAIQASRAPVYVVVKGFAASMAAVIATLAPHSCAYPNAIILHHQPWTVSFGNPTQQKEQLDILKDWYSRLGGPVAKKMGLTLPELTKEMYAKNSDGNWQEFGDRAVKLKWVDHVATEVRETGYYKKPSDEELDEAPPLGFGLKERVDERGRRFVQLPRLTPFDAYWIYDPDQYYRE